MGSTPKSPSAGSHCCHLVQGYWPYSAVEKTLSLSAQVTGTQISPSPYVALELGGSVGEMVLDSLASPAWALHPSDQTPARSPPPMGSHLGQQLIRLRPHLPLQIPHLPGQSGHQLRLMEYGDCQTDKVLEPGPRVEAEVWGSSGGGRGSPEAERVVEIVAAT